MDITKLAGCIIQNDAGAILLLHRNTPSRTQWEIPGGKLEPGEPAEDAVRREIQEELGVSVSLERFLGAKSFEQDGRVMDYQWYLGSITGTPQVMEPDTFDDLAYFTMEDLQAIHYKLSANAQNYLREVQNGHITTT
jgi:8-oxo-dGTP diphosphatase